MVKLRRCYKTWFNSDLDALGIYIHNIFIRFQKNIDFWVYIIYELKTLTNNNHKSFLSRDIGGYAMKGYGMGAIIIGATCAPGGAPVVCRAAGAAKVAPGVMGSATVLHQK